jgi:hypothetical protein
MDLGIGEVNPGRRFGVAMGLLLGDVCGAAIRQMVTVPTSISP